VISVTKKEDELFTGFKDFLSRNHRTPSLRELSIHVGWKKSVTNKYIQRLIGRGLLEYATDENGATISKSLTVKK
jgi:hypothetical protein